MQNRTRVPALACLLLALASTTAAAQSLPGIKRDLDFDAHMKTVDLDDPSLKLVYKKPTSDGSSIGVFIGKGDGPTNASFVPTNSSSIPEAEVVAYRLARFLGVSRNYYPVDYYKLGPKATAKFKAMVLGTRETDEDRINNRNMVIKEFSSEPDTLLGIYRIRPKSKLYPVNALGSSGVFNRDTALARAIRADGPMPGTQLVSLPGITGGKPDYPKKPAEQQGELARQLSTIFVIDQLLGQWDRFWENLEATGDKAGRVKLVARDNGGASLDDWEGYDAYGKWVTRYDRDLIAKLTALNAFLKGNAAAFSGHTKPESWQKAVGFINAPSFTTFRDKLARLVEQRVPSLTQQFGDKIYFPPKTAEIAALDKSDTGDDD